MSIIIDSLKSVYLTLTGEGVFLACCAIIFIAFIINFMLVLFAKNYDKKKRAWFYFLVLTVAYLHLSTSLLAEGNIGYNALIISFSLPLVGVSLAMKGCGEKVKREQLELARYLDEKVKEEDFFVDFNKANDSASKNLLSEEKQDLPIKPSNVKKLLEDKQEKESGLDFSHVKNVLSRLDYFSLSPADKRQVKELEVTLAEAERGEFNILLKEKLNDGLGMLLKIMSKYGV
jgi:hypothetical protein